MPLSPLTVSPYPNVPALPGVPALARLAAAYVPPPLLALADSFGLSIADSQWGVFDKNNAQVLAVDNVVGVDFAGDAEVPTYPQEQGAFGSYNKVQEPYQAQVTFTCGGSEAKRAAFLSGLETLRLSLDLYTVVTPERVYENANVVHYDWSRRFDKGVTLIEAVVALSEIRITATSTYTPAASQNGAAQQNGGTVQTTPYTAAPLPAPS